MALVSVTNNTSQARYFYFAAEVPTATGWTMLKAGWNARVDAGKGSPPMHRAKSWCRHPKSSAKWRLRCASVEEESKLKWLWYALVRRIGLIRFGFREGPSGATVGQRLLPVNELNEVDTYAQIQATIHRLDILAVSARLHWMPGAKTQHRQIRQYNSAARNENSAVRWPDNVAGAFYVTQDCIEL